MVKRKHMQRWGCIYRLTNTVNNKKYIGQSVDFNTRTNKHKRASHNPNTPISQAIQKYGWDAFKVEIVVDGIPEEDLDDLEDYYIDVENTLAPNGYNVRKVRGTVYFDNHCKKWRAYGPKKTPIGYYFTKEKAEQALKLYNETGERLESDRRMRKMGTGSIRKTKGGRYLAAITINKKRKSKTFDTPEQCEEWLTFMKNDLSI